MKRTKKTLLVIITFFQISLSITACSPKDTTVKADLAVKAKSDKDFAGIMFTVDKGIVTLSGACATEKSKSTVETTVKGVYGVKNIINKIAVSPVLIGTDLQLKQGVDSLLKDYPGVAATTKDSVVYLQGRVAGDQVIKLKAAVNGLKPKRLEGTFTSL